MKEGNVCRGQGATHLIPGDDLATAHHSLTRKRDSHVIQDRPQTVAAPSQPVEGLVRTVEGHSQPIEGRSQMV
jgi:hypothetical protein